VTPEHSRRIRKRRLGSSEDAECMRNLSYLYDGSIVPEVILCRKLYVK
jgi:hypothetical protein